MNDEQQINGSIISSEAIPTEIIEPEFDFENHRLLATDQYRKVRSLYQSFADVVQSILKASFAASNVAYHEIEARAKDLESFGKKATKSLETNPNKPKYLNPLEEIKDLAGVRVITFFPKSLSLVDHCINEDFLVIEKTDKSEELEEEGKFGYKSIHYLVKMKSERLALPEYRNFADMVAEIQYRTILQHAWAEMEHDIQYKSVDVIPTSIKRRFIALAGMLEIADREFQAIQDEDERIRTQARINVKAGKLEEVEITPDALKSYLDEQFGSDGRMSAFSYEYLARQLRQMGFTNFKQIGECIEGYNADQVSRLVWGTRQGQITRFEDLLRAGMGSNFVKLHPYSKEDWGVKFNTGRLERLNRAGVLIKNYSPRKEIIVS